MLNAVYIMPVFVPIKVQLTSCRNHVVQMSPSIFEYMTYIII